jgi:hypothetical protein
MAKSTLCLLMTGYSSPLKSFLRSVQASGSRVLFFVRRSFAGFTLFYNNYAVYAVPA